MNLLKESRAYAITAALIATVTTGAVWTNSKDDSRQSSIDHTNTFNFKRTTPTIEKLSLSGISQEALELHPECIINNDNSSITQHLHELVVGSTRYEDFPIPTDLSNGDKMQIEGEKMTLTETLRQEAIKILQNASSPTNRTERLTLLYADTAADQLRALEDIDPDSDSVIKDYLQQAATCSIASATSLDADALYKR